MVQLSHPYLTTGKTIALTIEASLSVLFFNNICSLSLCQILVILTVFQTYHYYYTYYGDLKSSILILEFFSPSQTMLI